MFVENSRMKIVDLMKVLLFILRWSEWNSGVVSSIMIRVIRLLVSVFRIVKFLIVLKGVVVIWVLCCV